jgi:hypothetical protein
MRMRGIETEGYFIVFMESESVNKNITFYELTLSEKHGGICYHKARNAQDAETT